MDSLRSWSVDKERIKATKQLKEDFKNDKDMLLQLKYTMWPFRYHPKDLDDEEKQRLEKLFKIAPRLKQCYDLNESLYEIFENTQLSKQEAKKQIDTWCLNSENYETKGFNPFTSFIDTYRNYEENILNYFTHPISFDILL